jgi:hypothetical protein
MTSVRRLGWAHSGARRPAPPRPANVRAAACRRAEMLLVEMLQRTNVSAFHIAREDGPYLGPAAATRALARARCRQGTLTWRPRLQAFASIAALYRSTKSSRRPSSSSRPTCSSSTRKR